MALDIVFSLDSVITAVGMAQHVAIMIAAVIMAVLVMMVVREGDRGFRRAPPDGQDAGARFLLADRRHADRRRLRHHVPKGYIYFAMAFSLFVEMLNLRAGHREAPVHLRQPYVTGADEPPAKPRA